MPPIAVAIAGVCFFYLLIGVLRALAIQNPVGPDSGCRGCGAVTADALVHDDDRHETYCWPCIDGWPASTTPLEQLTVSVFPGHERSAA